ncbi:UNVERIFIED_CONTAM: hypothetical protein PYX00_009850 [Menopon gallinae]|uniref:Lysosome membrane protein 2 n=1 Tax=Menopon gallinae TaxID=328185 RepID=A0AAW2HDJ3_9NEOP
MRTWRVRKTFIYIIATCGSVLMLIGVMLTLKDSIDFTMILLSKKMALWNDSDAMKAWKKAPFPVLFKVYIWNVTNPKEVSAGAKPRLTELGPYVYERWLEKANVKEEENETLSYNENATMLFSEALSRNRRETDMVTIIHLPIVGMVLRVDEMMPEYVSYLNPVFPALFPGVEDIFLRATVRDLLFDGIPIDCSSSDFMVTTACNNLEEDLPKTIRKVGEKAFRFSFFDYKRRLSPDVMRVYRGTDDIRKLGKFYSFNNAMSVKKWHNEYCDMLNGSDGSHMPVNLKKDDLVYLFQADLCRAVYAKFEREVYREKIKLFRYVNTPDLFASAKKNPNNECFCVPKAQLSDFLGGDDDDDADAEEGERNDTEKPKTCPKAGSMIMTPCVGAPVVITFPHFYMGDESFSEYVQLEPNKQLHETFVEVEPISGIPFLGSKRVQFNIEVKAIPDMEFMSNLTPGLFPVLWVEESMELPESFSSQLSGLLTLHSYIGVAGFTAIAAATVILIAAGVCYVKKNNSVSWGTDEGLNEAPAGHFNPTDGFGMNGIYSNRVKVPINISGNIPANNISNGLMPNYPILTKRNAGRVYPNPAIYRENFI